ncbi:MAG: right-handed parallel beta-helix repeat-containing protein, partial [Candidatus Syntrophoarchaeum sp.]|nr:right-handed parallel beta-helix repeat-containing protein [Candidatus Syntrophoarchaeum sp.]
MKKKNKPKIRIATMIFMALMMTSVFAMLAIGIASASTWYVEEGESIQAAVDAAKDGDTIIVRDGIYTENVDVYERLTIKSENGADSTIVQAANPNDHVFMVRTNYVTICGFTVKGATEENGIYISHADYCNISNNICLNNGWAGIRLWHSNNSVIKNNICSSNTYDGINLDYSNKNTIKNNNCSNNEVGISLGWYSHNNSITNNTCLNNWLGIQLSDSNSSVIANNTCSNNTESGIHLSDSNSSVIINNTCSNNGGGIDLWYSNSNVVTNNTCSENGGGIYLRDSNNNIITNNNCSSNKEDGINLGFSSNNNSISSNNCSENGIFLRYSENNELTGNTIINDGIFIFGFLLSNYNTHDIDTSNKVNGKPVYYWKDVREGRIPNGAGQVILANCSNAIVENQELNNTGVGIEVAFSSFITLKNNNCSNNEHSIDLWYSNNIGILNNNCSSNKWDGIHLYKSNNNNISYNNCSNNRDEGIYLYSSCNNKMYLNKFINNTDNVYSYESTNIWNSTEKIIYIYSSKTYTSYLGNYWDDYEGIDDNKDGIGDTSYEISGDNNDIYPLMARVENYALIEGIYIEAGKTIAVESDRIQLVVTGVAGHTINIIVPTNATFPGGLNNNPPTDIIGPSTITDIIDADGKRFYVVCFNNTGVYTVTVIDTITNSADSVDIEVREKVICFDIPCVCVIGETLKIRGTAKTGNIIDIAINHSVRPELNDILIDCGEFEKEIETDWMVAGIYKIEGFI